VRTSCKTGSLGDFIELKRGYDLPTRLRTAGQHPIVSSSGVTGTHTEAKIKGPGVVTGRYGTIGEVFYIDKDFWPLNTTLYVRDFKGNDVRFISYFLKTIDYTAYSDKAAVPGVNRNHLHQAQVSIPPLEVQRDISVTLSLLDQKIELNRQTARTLEELAQRLFKSWFVDFDPVRARMAGRQPAHTPPEIAELFPDRLVDSPLGPIPEGWEIKPIESIVTIKGGATPSTKEKAFWDGGTYHWATPKDLSGLQQKVLITTDRKITSAGVERISSGQLPPGTVLMSSRAPVGYLALADMPVSVNQGFIAMICDQGVPNTFVLHWAEANMDVIKSNAGGSTFAEISMKQFRPLEVIVPPEQLVRAFDEMATDWFQRVSQLARQNVTLAQLRDRLLPKLISGEIRVPEHAG
jgi:type I restriction enzyme, S subunit